jgi:hypothetical protein
MPEYLEEFDRLKLVIICDTESDVASVLNNLAITTKQKASANTTTTRYPECGNDDISSLKFEG